MAYLSEAKTKALPLNQFMAQFIKLGKPSKKRASEALADYKRKAK